MKSFDPEPFQVADGAIMRRFDWSDENEGDHYFCIYEQNKGHYGNKMSGYYFFGKEDKVGFRDWGTISNRQFSQFIENGKIKYKYSD